MYVWHNTRGIANQYFVVNSKDKVLFEIPKCIGRLFCKENKT